MSELSDNKVKVWRPQKGFQEKFVRSNVDFLVGGSAMGVGKTFAALLMAAEHTYDPNFRMVFLRRNIADLKAGGAGADEATKIYGSFASMKMSESPRLTFPSGALIDFTHMSDQTPDKVLERVRGWAYSLIYIDEGTGFEWSTIRILSSRNRSAGKWSGKIRITCNPKKSHWLRKWCDWYINPLTGYPIPERDGVIRYFYIKGDRIEDVVFGSTYEEVYEKCKVMIDPIVAKMNQGGHNYTYKNLIKTTTFYSGKLSDNQELLKNNPNYLGSVAAMGEKQAAANLMGCWNVDPDEEDKPPIKKEAMNNIFNNDPQVNGDKWITVDLADFGKDNYVALVWNGFHIIDSKIMQHSYPRLNAEITKQLAEKHDISDSHIIFDGTNGMYMKDYIPDAMEFISNRAPRGVYGRSARTLKDECYMRLVSTINGGRLSCEDEVANRRYIHSENKMELYFSTELLEECAVVRFKDCPNGKKTLMNKKEMNAMLGKGRSMDVLDPCAMRMLPVLEYNLGEELYMSGDFEREEREEDAFFGGDSIYDDSTWA